MLFSCWNYSIKFIIIENKQQHCYHHQIVCPLVVAVIALIFLSPLSRSVYFLITITPPCYAMSDIHLLHSLLTLRCFAFSVQQSLLADCSVSLLSLPLKPFLLASLRTLWTADKVRCKSRLYTVVSCELLK